MSSLSDTSPTDLEPDPPGDRRPGRRRSLLVGTVAAGLAVLAAAGAAMATARLTDESDPTRRVDADIRFAPEDDESAQPLLAEDRTGELAPDDPFPLLDGGLSSLADLRGTPVVVNFFASWCEPCKAEMPDLAAVHAELGTEVSFLGINVRDREDDARALLAATGVDYAVARDPSGSLQEAFGVVNMPSTFFLDADGRIVSSHPGVLSADELRAELATLR
jgi:thiol-disulfide isomerase/thioredoxin